MSNPFLEQASTYARDIDNLIALVAVLVGFWFLLVEGVFFWLIFKFKATKGGTALYIDGTKKEHKKWIAIPHYLVLVCDILIIVAAVRVWMDVKQTLPQPDAVVKIMGQQWAWTFTHPGKDNVIDTADDIQISDELHVEIGKTYHYRLESKDVMHSFSVPVFRLKQDAIPGRMIVGWFTPTKTGEHDIQCAEICGIGHGLMPARIFIETPEEHAAWIAKMSAPRVAQIDTQKVRDVTR